MEWKLRAAELFDLSRSIAAPLVGAGSVYPWEKLKEMQDKTFLPYKNYRYKGKPCQTIQDLEERFKDELGE